MSAPKVLAFVLPQFHRIPENDAWWGEGFTEWTNVRKAKPLFARHNQPRVPLNENYYDLLEPAAQDWQATLAREHRVHGFCYYHYWFNGKQLLEKPLETLLRRGRPDLPFCLAWANEPWTRAWDGGEHQVLMPQSYGGEPEWRAHFQYLLRVFRDPRYIRVEGKPMLLIYRSASIPDCERMFDLWRNLALQSGLPGLHLVSMLTWFEQDRRVTLFDAFAEFEPMFTIRHGLSRLHRMRERLRRKLVGASWRVFGRGPNVPHSYDYASLWRSLAGRVLPPRTYPGAFVDWDNTPRRGAERAMTMRNFELEAFGRGLRRQLRKARRAGAEFVFINAWNEWAEGTYLEPDTVRNNSVLQAVQAAVEESDVESSMST